MLFTPAEFGSLTQGMGIFVLICALITGIAFVRAFDWRYRMVGITSFSVVLTAGLFALSLAPITQTAVSGAVPYNLVFDRLGAQAVIAVPATITAPQLEATLKQAASNLYSSGRNSPNSQLTIKARIILHPRPGVSQLVYVGQIERSLRSRIDPEMVIKIERDRLPKPLELNAPISSVK
jgi:hypothetical protein